MARTIREVIDEIQATPDDGTTFSLLAELYLMLSYRWDALSLESTLSQEDANRKMTRLAKDIEEGITEVMMCRRNSILGRKLDYSNIYEWRQLDSDEDYIRRFVDEPVEVKK